MFALVIAGYGLGALAGTAVCAAVAGRVPSIAVPVVLGGLALINLFAFSHPWWFVPAAAVVLVAGWWIGTRIAARIGAG